jgi:hypothetical protein
MTQEDVLEWVKAHGCHVTHEKKKFFRVVNSEGQAMGIPQPREGQEFLQPMTVCRICYMLKVPIPDYAKPAFERYAEIQKQHHNRDL